MKAEAKLGSTPEGRVPQAPEADECMPYCRDTLHWYDHALPSASDRFMSQAAPVLPDLVCVGRKKRKDNTRHDWLRLSSVKRRKLMPACEIASSAGPGTTTLYTQPFFGANPRRIVFSEMLTGMTNCCR